MAKTEREIVTPDITLRLAAILGLDIDEKRAAELAPQIQGLRDGVEILDSVDVTDVEPALEFSVGEG